MKSISGIFLIVIALQLFSSCAEEDKKEDKKDTALLVKLDEVVKKKFIHEIRIQGSIETDKNILINAEMSGLITGISVKEGQAVSKGQTLATVDASILASNMEELKAQLEYAEYLFNKQEELNKRGVGSEFELKAAKNQVISLQSKIKSMNIQKGKATIRAPFSGIIDKVFAHQGQLANPQSSILRLVNNKTVDVVASLSEKHYARVHVGTPIKVTFPNYMDTSITLNVTHVGNFIEPTNRTFRIMSTIANNSFLLPNMLAELSITDIEVEDAMVIPSKSILKDKDNFDFVYIAVKKGSKYVVKKVNIEVLNKFQGEALIESGTLNFGEKIISEGARGITEGDFVKMKK